MATTMQPAVYSEGQDSSELFDLYEAPPSLGILPAGTRPQAKGLTKPRKLVHSDGDWHAAVHIWLINDKGKLVLQRRSKYKDTFPGMWDVSVGGHMTAGDDSLTTATKETAEELGIQVQPDELQYLFTIATSAEGSTERHGSFNCNEYKDVYLLPFNGCLEDIHFAEGEVEEVKWEDWQALQAKLTNRHESYIPRSQDYVAGLFDAISSKFK